MTQRSLQARPAAGLLAGLTVLGVLSACSNEIDTPLASNELQSMDADAIAYGMTSFITSSGVRQGKIEADTAYVYEESSSAILKQMSIVFYDDNGTERATVTGDTGDWNRATDRMVARGNVKLLIQSDSSIIESAEIYYDPQLDRIWSDSSTVRTLKDGSVQSGTSFESDMSFENLTIANMRGGVRRVF